MSIAGGCDRAVRAAHAVDFADRPALHQEQQPVERPRLYRPSTSRPFARPSSETGIVDPVAHTSYLINLASPDDDSVAEIDRRDDGRGGALRDARNRRPGRPSRARTWVRARKPDCPDRAGASTRSTAAPRALDVTIDLETTAGQGTNLGYRFEHLAGYPRPRGPPRASWVCAWIHAIFSRRAIHWSTLGGVR